MKILYIITLGLLSLLSIAAGAAKVMQVPQEMAFLQSFGLSVTAIIAFGSIQIVAGILLAIPKTRLYGAGLVSLGFLISSVLVFTSGDIGFGLFSLLPLIVACIVVYHTGVKPKNTH
jgi:hypothetical protein